MWADTAVSTTQPVTSVTDRDHPSRTEGIRAGLTDWLGCVYRKCSACACPWSSTWQNGTICTFLSRVKNVLHCDACLLKLQPSCIHSFLWWRSHLPSSVGHGQDWPGLLYNTRLAREWASGSLLRLVCSMSGWSLLLYRGEDNWLYGHRHQTQGPSSSGGYQSCTVHHHRTWLQLSWVHLRQSTEGIFGRRCCWRFGGRWGFGG